MASRVKDQPGGQVARRAERQAGGWTAASIADRRAALTVAEREAVEALDPVAYIAADSARREFESLMIFGAVLTASPSSTMMLVRSLEDRAMFQSAYLLAQAAARIEQPLPDPPK